MNNVKKYYLFLQLIVICFFCIDCSNHENIKDIDDDTTSLIKIDLKGEIEGYLTKNGTPLYAVQIWEKAEGESVYNPSRIGLFDSKADISFSTKKGIIYKLVVTYVDSEYFIRNSDGKTYRRPFDGIIEDRNNDLNKFFNNSSEFPHLGQGANHTSFGIIHYPREGRAYVSKEDIAYNTNNLQLELKWCNFSIRVKINDESVMKYGTKIYYKLHNGLEGDNYKIGYAGNYTKDNLIAKDSEGKIIGQSKKYTLFYIAEAANNESYSEDLKMDLEYAKDGNIINKTTIDLNNIQRKKEYVINITSITQGMSFKLESLDFDKGDDVDNIQL